MSPLRANRLVACLLLILLIGWAAKWWRTRMRIDDIPVPPGDWVEDNPSREAVLPRE